MLPLKDPGKNPPLHLPGSWGLGCQRSLAAVGLQPISPTSASVSLQSLLLSSRGLLWVSVSLPNFPLPIQKPVMAGSTLIQYDLIISKPTSLWRPCLQRRSYFEDLDGRENLGNLAKSSTASKDSNRTLPVWNHDWASQPRLPI